MIHISKLTRTLMHEIDHLAQGHYLDVRCYKKDRAIYFIKEDENIYHIIEDGFKNNEFHMTFQEIEPLLKKLIKREFPRSNQIHLDKMGVYNASSHKRINGNKS